MVDLLRRLGESVLPELVAEDRTVASAFGLSYEQLPERARQLFRLLGLHPGERFEALAVAALTGGSLHRTRELLDDLVDVHLVEEPEPGIFRLHDLLSEYATALAAELPADERRLAVLRLLDFHLHAFVAANEGPHRQVAQLDLRIGPPRRRDLAAALEDPFAHLERERPNLTALLDAATAAGLTEWVWRLPRAAWRYLFTRGYVPELDALLRRGLDAAQELNDQVAVATCANYVASCAVRLGRRDEARSLLENAVRIGRTLRDDERTARSMGNLAALYDAEGRFVEVIETCRESLRIGLRLPDSWMNSSLRHNAIGVSYARLGRLDAALWHFRIRLQLAIQMTDPLGVACSLYGIGMVKWLAGTTTVEHNRRMIDVALRMVRKAGYASGEAECLNQLALLAHAERQPGTALDLLGQAIVITERIGLQRYESLLRSQRGEFLLAAGDADGARTSCAEAVRLARTRFPYEWAVALSGRAAVHLAEGEPAAARRLWEQALILFTRMEVTEVHDVEQRLAAFRSGTDQLRTPAGGGRMDG